MLRGSCALSTLLHTAAAKPVLHFSIWPSVCLCHSAAVLLLAILKLTLSRQAGLSRVKSNLMGQVKRGKMNQQQVDKLLTKLKGTLSYDDFKDVDMVVEAVIESIDLKQKIFAGAMLEGAKCNIVGLLQCKLHPLSPSQPICPCPAHPLS